MPENYLDMKAAVLHQYGEAPKYGDFPDPIPQNDNQVLITVKAAAVKNLDKGKASGAHYSSGSHLAQPETVGMDGVGLLEDGTRVYAFGLTGMVAEKALADKRKCVVLPASIDDASAAALPNAIFGAAAALRFRANIVPGDTVLINGGTGVTGKLAIQIAKHYGAGRIIATGRNADSLQKLLTIGADEIISLKQDDDQIVAQLKAIHSATPIDIVIDYLWGHPVEMILMALKGKGHTTHKVRIVTVGEMAGSTIALPSGILRSSDIEILGSGLGSLPEDAMDAIFTEILPDMLQLAANGQFEIETVTYPLKDIEAAWMQDIGPGKRLVIIM